MHNRFAGRLDASDVVQQTCMSALRHFPDFQGDDPAEFDAGLRQVHRRNLIDEVRKHSGSAKRDATREVAGNDPEGAPSKLLAQQSTPSRAAIRADEAVELERAIAKLPPAQAQVVRMKHLQGRKLSEIAQAIGRSDEAVAGLLRRGLRQLRSQFDWDRVLLQDDSQSLTKTLGKIINRLAGNESIKGRADGVDVIGGRCLMEFQDLLGCHLP